MKLLRLLSLLIPSLLCSPLPAEPKKPETSDDFYICAAINKNYVIGSKIVTVNGMFRRTDEQTWDHVGYNDTTIISAAFDPRDHNVVYTAAFNGCWRTLDGGKTWRMTNSWDMTEGRDVVVDSFAPDTVYLAINDGIARSQDRAQTWQRFEKGLPERGKYTQVLRLDRTQKGRLLAGCESGIYLNENDTWERVLPTVTTVTDIQQSPHDPRHWLASTQSDGAWASHDRGTTWAKFDGVPSDKALYSIIFDRVDPKRFAVGNWARGILVTEDGGKTWSDRNAGLPDSPRVWRLGVEPKTNRLFASVVGEALYSSDDFGRTWKKDGMEGSVVHNFLIVPKAGN
jgi:photosystem II stability/assembly factor-like uncharacterized protein